MNARHTARIVALALFATPAGGCFLQDVQSVAPGIFGPAPASSGTPAQGGVVSGAGLDSADDGTVLARGTHGELSDNDVAAFLEALEFSLREAGYDEPITPAQRQEMRAAMVQAYPQADAETQQVLADAPRIWSEVQQQWPTASEADRRAFVAAVLGLAFGEPEPTGGAGGGTQVAMNGGGHSSAAGCETIDDCVTQYSDPQTLEDTNNAMSCWASAGCESYDAGTDSFTYEEPSYDTPSYDTPSYDSYTPSYDSY